MRGTYSRIAVNRRVLVNLNDGKAFDGVLWQDRGPLVVLRDAYLLIEGREPAKLDGDVLVDRAQISFVQMPPARS